jgi:hypothetical protein
MVTTKGRKIERIDVHGPLLLAGWKWSAEMAEVSSIPCLDAQSISAIVRGIAFPPDDELTYSTSNLEDTIRVFDKHGVHLLTLEEIAQHMPTFGKLVETRRQP